MDKWVVSTYVLLCLFFYMYWRRKSPGLEAFIKLGWVLCLPVAGFIVLFYEYRHKEGREFEVQLPFFDSQADSRGDIYRNVNLVKEMNVIPVEEALLINDTETKRKILIDALKDDAIQYMHILEQAVRNEDTETSHYAATAVVEIKRRLTLALQEFAVKYEENRRDLELLQPYAVVLKQFLQSGFLDERTKKKYEHTYVQILGHILEQYQGEEHYFKEKFRMELQLGELDAATATCFSFERAFPLHEDVHLLYIELYFVMRNKQQLLAAVDKLKKLPFRLSNHALHQIRLWTQEV
ncbi:hypothetical protein [Paenibacillus rigui]|uniref:Uncharacterized protein n=1 Tax=Paenibacillus rigui TaxID=554312 RepID=A0A229UTD9_9BACL|nr:hypothetical protein [Paenibacillus rigui]OXM86662.1 hypothetical protein CF651_09450 [Paenibacillus rigui]